MEKKIIGALVGATETIFGTFTCWIKLEFSDNSYQTFEREGFKTKGEAILRGRAEVEWALFSTGAKELTTGMQ